MRRLQFIVLLLCSFLWVTESQGQLLKRGVSRGGYTVTENGYLWYGKEYIRGRDLPANPDCGCPMCRDLVSAFYAARQTKKPVAENAVTKLIGTPHEDIEGLVDVFQIEKGSDFVLLDPGCGDARILIYAVKKYGCRAIGIEINEDTYKIALLKVKEAGLEHRIKIYNGDSRKYSWEKADGVVMFLFPELISDLTKSFRELQYGTKVVSYSHDIPLEGTVKCQNIYVWRKDEDGDQ